MDNLENCDFILGKHAYYQLQKFREKKKIEYLDYMMLKSIQRQLLWELGTDVLGTKQSMS